MKSFCALVKTFVLLELRGKEVSVVTFGTLLLVTMLLVTGVGTAFVDPLTVSKIFPFIFWTSIITSCSVALGRSFESELRYGVFEALVSSGISLRPVFFAKQLVVATLLFVAMTFGLLLLGSMFQIPLRETMGELALICVILSVAYSGLGNILSVVSLGSSVRSSLLPLLLIPCSFPLFFASLELTYGVLLRDPEVFDSPWMAFSVFLAVLYSLLGAALFPAAVKAQL